MYLIFSVILVVAQALILLFPLLFKFSLPINFIPLIALAILWINRLFCYGKSGTTASGASVFRVILWVLFAVFSLIGIVSAIFMVFSGGDREQKKAPVVFGSPDSSKNIAIIYHPGGSNLPKDAITRIAKSLSQKGVRVTLYTAYTGLTIDLKEVTAVGFASPVYGGETRPPLVRFINRTDLSGIKCFGIITGMAQSGEPYDLEKVKNLIESKGGIFITGKKFTSASLNKKSEIEALVEQILNQL